MILLYLYHTLSMNYSSIHHPSLSHTSPIPLSHLTFLSISLSLFYTYTIYIYICTHIDIDTNLTSQIVIFSMATIAESLALSSLSNLRPSLSLSLTSPPPLSLSVRRNLTALPQFTGLRIQLPSHRPVSSLSSRNPRVLRRSSRISCEAQETALDSKFFV